MFPTLSKLAHRIYFVLCSSAAVEREFSTVDLIVNQSRYNLDPTTVNNILFLRSTENGKKIDWSRETCFCAHINLGQGRNSWLFISMIVFWYESIDLNQKNQQKIRKKTGKSKERSQKSRKWDLNCLPLDWYFEQQGYRILSFQSSRWFFWFEIDLK